MLWHMLNVHVACPQHGLPLVAGFYSCYTISCHLVGVEVTTLSLGDLSGCYLQSSIVIIQFSDPSLSGLLRLGKEFSMNSSCEYLVTVEYKDPRTIS